MSLAEYKLEEAVQDLLQAQADIASLIAADLGKQNPFDVYIGIDESAVNYSCILVAVPTSVPVGRCYGDWKLALTVKVFTNIKGGTKEQHKQRIGYVRDILFDDAVLTSINALSADLCITTVTDFAMMTGRSNRVANDCWIHETILEIPCRDGD